MATRAFTVEIPIYAQGASAPSAYIVTWAGLLNGDDGAPFVCPNRADKSVQVLGTFGAAGNLQVQGTNKQAYSMTPGVSGGGTLVAVDADYAILNDPQANALDITGAKIEQILENPNAVRPKVTAGDVTTSLTVVMVVSAPITKF
jgi:hypothetical protein